MPTVPTVDVLAPPEFFGKDDLQDIITLSREQISAANEYLDELGDLVGNLQIPYVNFYFPEPAQAPTLGNVTPPTIEDVEWVDPPFPAALTETLDISTLLPDPFEEDAPVLSYPVAPEPFAEDAPDAPGIDVEYDYPTLSVTLPDAPNLLSISVPAFNGVTIPEFTVDAPTLNLASPSVTPFTSNGAYSSALLTLLETTLNDRIANGGTGLDADVEEAIWNRGREREARAAANAIDELERMETLGYALPPGAYIDARIKIQTEMGYNASMISREIMIEQAQLEQKNVLAAIESARMLEGQLMQSYDALENRRLEAAKYATTAAVEIYNAKVRSFSAQVEVFRARVTAYEAQVRGAIAEVEAYKAQVDAEQAKAQVNQALVNQYRVQIDAALSNIEIFKARIAGIQAKADVEKLKISIYGEEIRAYVGKVNAYTARTEAYRARIQAEATRSDAYRSQVAAYSAQVDAAVKQIDAQIAEYRGLLDAKRAEYDGYRAQVAGETARVQGVSAMNQATVDAYSAEVRSVAAFNEALTKQWEGSIRLATAQAEVAVQQAKANADLYLAARQVAIEASKVAAQVSAQLGAAALNAVNFSNSASISHSNVRSGSGSASDNRSESTSTSTSENTNTNYNASI